MRLRHPGLTLEQIEEATRLRASASYRSGKKMDPRRIAKIMQIPESAIRTALDLWPRKRNPYLSSGGDGRERVGRVDAPPEVLAERAYAYNAPYEVTRELMGEPRPGRSALEKLMQNKG